MEDIVNKDFIAALYYSKQGVQLYFVGGCVRDRILGKVSKDIDILVYGSTLDEIALVLEPFGKVDLVGKSFGVIKFTTKGVTYDIAVPRIEIKTREGHQGFEVDTNGVSVKDDLLRRDFTMNAMLMSIPKLELIDFHRGEFDIADKRIRHVNDCAFTEDPLRMLRAVQFAVRLDFKISVKTFELIKANSSKLVEISGERIVIELEKMVKSKNLADALDLLTATDLHWYFLGKEDKFNITEKAYTQIDTLGEFLYTIYRDSNIEPSRIFEALKLDTYTQREFIALTDIGYSINMQDTRKAVFKNMRTFPEILETHYFDYGLKGVAIKSMARGEYPTNHTMLDIKIDMLKHLGLEGGALGKMLDKIFDAIFTDKVKNTFHALLKFVQDEMDRVQR